MTCRGDPNRAAQDGDVVITMVPAVSAVLGKPGVARFNAEHLKVAVLRADPPPSAISLMSGALCCCAVCGRGCPCLRSRRNRSVHPQGTGLPLYRPAWPGGEDGTAGRPRTDGIPYTGSGVMARRSGRTSGGPSCVAVQRFADSARHPRGRYRLDAVAELGFAHLVKPADEGSSMPPRSPSRAAEGRLGTA